ncbi:MAG: lytic transglycosylase domain-containing protein, partial [Hyphomicrobiales bacterium]|nr:lytic transglycosylase domain-containing protein [Hyphomicrobiales bacterium]
MPHPFRLAAFVLLAALCGVGVGAAATGGPQPREETLAQSVCRLIESSAHLQGLPVVFLTRLIWQESSFQPGAVSPAGAQGIAQFMPGTASDRGLANPFDPEEAIPKAAA